jgi:hypothetical protein
MTNGMSGGQRGMRNGQSSSQTRGELGQRLVCAVEGRRRRGGKGEGGHPFYAWPAGLSASNSHDDAILFQASRRQNYEERTLTTHCSVRLLKAERDRDGAEVVVTVWVEQRPTLALAW